MAQIILTAVGPDRPGIVADLSKHVHQAEASLCDSRMVNLRGHFALLALVEGSSEALAKLRAVLGARSEELGLRLEIMDADAPQKGAIGGVPYRLKTYSEDQPGIVARVTEVLLRHGVNVEDLETRVESAPFAGTPLFIMEATVLIPKGVSVRKIRDELASLGDTIGIDVDLDAA